MGLPDGFELGFGLDLGSLTSGILNYFSQKETNKANRELAELAYQQNVEQWERENAYNHPAEQMQRLQEAGLNPNLVYGNGSAVQTSAHSPQMSYPQMQAPQMNLAGQGFSLSRSPLVESQKSVNSAMVESYKAQAIQAIANANNLDARTKRQIIENLYADQKEAKIIQMLDKQIENFDKQWKLWASTEELNTSIKELNQTSRNKILKEIEKLGVDIKSAEAIFEKWGQHGMTPAQGFEQLGAQMAWLALKLPGPGVKEGDITIFDNELPDKEFEEKFGYKKYSPKYWAQINKQSGYTSGNQTTGWSSNM